MVCPPSWGLVSYLVSQLVSLLVPFVAGGLILHFFPNSVRFGVLNFFSGHVFDPVPQKHVLNPPSVWGLRWSFFHNSGRLHVVPPKFQTQRQISRHMLCIPCLDNTFIFAKPRRQHLNQHNFCQPPSNLPGFEQQSNINETYTYDICKEIYLYIYIYTYDICIVFAFFIETWQTVS